MAGHNRWSKVRTVKGPRDEQRSRLFQRLSQQLRVAAREGGPDPALNAPLAHLLGQCRAHNMPKASIEAALRGADRALGGSQLLLEGRGPGGFALLLEVLTDNPRRAQQEIRTLLTRNGGSLSEGSRHSFEAQGVVLVAPRDGHGATVPMEVALEVALAAGAQDVVPDEDDEGAEPALKFLCAPSALHGVRAHLEAAGLRPLSATTEFVPVAPVALPEEPLEKAQKLLQALEECPDIIRLFHNIQ